MIKKYGVYLMGVFYILAGVNHFWHTAFYTKIIPPFIPYALALVYISGVAEILCGAGLMVPATRKIAAWGTVALLIAVFPANIHMALHSEYYDVSKIGLYLRIPIQFVLIWWAYIYTKD